MARFPLSRVGTSTILLSSALWQTFVGFSGVNGQTTNATCLASFAWAENSKGQIPCQVAAFLGSSCSGTFLVTSLQPDFHYLGPDSAHADACLCSTVVYSLISACGACQNRTWIDWADWSLQCPKVYVGVFPGTISPQTSVPHWAYLNPTIVANGTFDPNLALADSQSGAPESTATFSQSTQTAIPNPSSIGENSSIKKSSNPAGAIAGGVVGGLVGIAIIALLVFALLRRRTKLAPSTQFRGAPSIHSPFGHRKGSSSHGTTFTVPIPLSPGGPQRLYDPNDPSTFPRSPPPMTLHSGGSVDNVYVTRQNNNVTSPSVMSPTYRPQGLYHGAAEL